MTPFEGIPIRFFDPSNSDPRHATTYLIPCTSHMEQIVRDAEAFAGRRLSWGEKVQAISMYCAVITNEEDVK